MSEERGNQAPSTHSALTDLGLPGVRRIPFGVHMCNFYRRREDLAAVLVPYFAAGLRANERCIWVTAEPLRAPDARDALRASGLDVEQAIDSGRLIIRDYADWYVQGDALKGREVVDLWLAEESRALAEGYSGLRITGNVTFLRPQDWHDFMQYEALLDRLFRTRRIVSLCTYRLDDCGPAEVLDVMRHHNCALDRPDAGWQILTAGARPA